MRLQIGELTFDGETRQLLQGAAPVPLSTRAFELLELLLHERPRAVSHQEIRDRLWPGTHVSYTAIPRLVSEIRRVLGDEARASRFVRSVHRYGYAWSGPAVAVDGGRAPEARDCELIWGQRAIPLYPGTNLIGRDSECRVRIVSGKVSRHHARLTVGPDGVLLEDLGSRNGTWWRGHRLGEAVVLADGDEIGLGEEILIFRTGEQQPTETDDRRR